MDRRHFLKNSLATTGAAAVLATRYKDTLAALADQPAKRVGLIGTGWYGKCDLMRLIQVAPVEVVSLCDVDSQMLNGAADLVAERQASKKRPRLYSDYKKLLAEKDLDIVLIGTPDHWHALPMIEAVKNGADVYVQKPISVDIVEGQAMLAAARKYNRVVQVGTQRRSTPHLIEAKKNIIEEGKLEKLQWQKSIAITICELAETRQTHRPLTTWILKLGQVRRLCGRLTRLCIRDRGEHSWNMEMALLATCAFTC